MIYVGGDRATQRRLLAEEPYVPADPQSRQEARVSGRPFSFIIAQLLDVTRHYQVPLSRQQESVGERFRKLAAKWRADVAILSSSTEIAMHPAYQQIVALGTDATPYILRELERSPDHWFWALKAITGIDPVKPQQRGRIEDMARAWLRWAREEGLEW